MPKAIVTPDLDAIISEIDISAPPSRVFEALTDPEQLMRWFTDASCPVKFWKMDARLGGSYSYATEKSNIVVNGVSEFKCRGEIMSSIRRGCWSTPGSATGILTRRRKQLCAGNSRPPHPAHT